MSIVQITNWNIIKQNEYSLFLSIPADGSIPAVTYIYIPRVSNAFGDLENYRKLSQLILIEFFPLSNGDLLFS